MRNVVTLKPSVIIRFLGWGSKTLYATVSASNERTSPNYPEISFLIDPSSLHDHNTALASLGTAESYGMRQGDGEAECAEASWVLDAAKNLCATEGTSAGMSDVVSMFCLSVGCQRTRS